WNSCSIGLYFVKQTRPFQVSLVCNFCSSVRDFASSFLQIPPRDGHPCLWLTVPTVKPVVDFHHQVIAHAGHTQKTMKGIVPSIVIIGRSNINIFLLPKYSYNKAFAIWLANALFSNMLWVKFFLKCAY